MSKTRHLLQIHGAVLLFGLAGLFGKWIALAPPIIVLGRVFFAALSLSLLLPVAGISWRLEQRRHYLLLGLLGALLAIHWITFFQAIQVSTVAVGLLTFSTFPIFTVLLEPLFFREERWRGGDLLLALITFVGVGLVVPRLNWSDGIARGAVWGVASGATFAVLAILNRRYVQQYASLALAWYQDATAAVLLLPFLWIYRPALTWADVGLLVLLGVMFTAVSHSLFIEGLRSVPARTASIIGSLEPVYGIAAAALLLNEIPSARVLAGGAVILATTTYVTLRQKKGDQRDDDAS